MGTLSSVFGLSCTPGCIFLWSWQPRPILLTIIALTHTHTHLNVHIYASILHILASIITSYFLAVIPTNRNSIWHIFWSFYLAFIGILSDTYADTLSDIYIVTCVLWHFIWHKFWHSIWHFIDISLAFYLASILTFYLPTLPWGSPWPSVIQVRWSPQWRQAGRRRGYCSRRKRKRRTRGVRKWEIEEVRKEWGTPFLKSRGLHLAGGEKTAIAGHVDVWQPVLPRAKSPQHFSHLWGVKRLSKTATCTQGLLRKGKKWKT